MFLFLQAPQAFAKPICLCSCVDAENFVTRLMPVTPDVGNTAYCQNNICDAACTAPYPVQLKSETYYNASSGRCVCACKNTAKTTKYAELTPGATDCNGSCASACGGPANLDPTQGSQQQKDAACVPDHPEDCNGGGPSVYEGIVCALRPVDTGETGWPDNVKPRCIVPVTPKNAKLECQNYGGIAKGGDCGELGAGDTPNTYFKSRPKFGKVGNDYLDFDTLVAWNAMLDQENTVASTMPDSKTAQFFLNLTNVTPGGGTVSIPADAGICYRLGAIYGTSGQVGSTEPPPVGIPSNKFVCLKKKTNTCGSIPWAGSSTVNSGKYFKCQKPEEYESNFPSDTGHLGCISGHPEACASLPGYVCCPQKSGGCYTDRECGAGMKCEGPNILKLQPGKCTVNSICDDKNPTWKCRSATGVEQSTLTICTPNSTLPSAFPRCLRPYETCCDTLPANTLSGCAADLYVDPANYKTQPQWLDFYCAPIKDIPSQEWAGNTLRMFAANTQNFITLKGYVNNSAYTDGHCLTTSIVRPGTTESVSRCPNVSYCCSRTALEAENGASSLTASIQGRAASLASCSPTQNPDTGASPYKCYSGINEFLKGTTAEADAKAKAQGFADAWEMVKTLASSQGCKVTPLLPGVDGLYQNRECQNNELCCLRDYSTNGRLDITQICNNDDACKAVPMNNCSSNNKEGCLKCDPLTHTCKPDQAINAAANASGSCYLRASALGENGQDIVDRTGMTTDKFTCQVVSSTATNVQGYCLAHGCEDLDKSGNAPAGSSFFCCIPGVGQTPGAASKAAAAGKVAVPQAPYSLWLPTCVTTNEKCTLDDIVMTGAHFATFLIEISGSIFLAIFVYGGFLYLTAGSSDRAAKGKKTIIQATYAIALMMAAFIFISFIQNSLIGAATGGGESTCGKDAATANFECTFLVAPANDAKAMSEERTARKCVQNKCKGPTNYVCCPTN